MTMGVIASRPTARPSVRSRSQIISRPSIETLTFAQERRGDVSTVTVTSSLSGAVYYHWYVNGVHWAMTTTNQYSFVAVEQLRIDVIPTNDPGFDFEANAPAVPDDLVTLWWVRSTDTDVKEYKVEQQKDAGGWSTIATVAFIPSTWDYRVETRRLDDLASYEWRVTPVDAAGNEGSTAALDARDVVRIPDAPDFDIAFDEGTTKVTFSEAA